MIIFLKLIRKRADKFKIIRYTVSVIDYKNFKSDHFMK